jgi:hypothetical protein
MFLACASKVRGAIFVDSFKRVRVSLQESVMLAIRRQEDLPNCVLLTRVSGAVSMSKCR